MSDQSPKVQPQELIYDHLSVKHYKEDGSIRVGDASGDYYDLDKDELDELVHALRVFGIIIDPPSITYGPGGGGGGGGAGSRNSYVVGGPGGGGSSS